MAHMFLCSLLAGAAVAAQAGDPFPLWTPDRPVPAAEAAPQVQGAWFSVIQPHAPDTDGYPWLHGVALAWHKGRLYASFGRNKGAENTAGEIAQGRVSCDGGKTWGPLFTIDTGEEPDLAVSHGVFLSQGGALWAFHGAFYGKMRDVHTRAYQYDAATGAWRKHGVVVEGGFWPMQEPRCMADGNYIMAGVRVGNGYGGADDPAAVAISVGDDLTQWELVEIPKPAEMEMWGESSVLLDGARILNIARWREPMALAAVSEDYGRTWTTMRRTNLPMAASKPYAGTLSTGWRYLVCTTTADSGNRRAPLTIAVSSGNEPIFSRIWRIRGAVHDGPGESRDNGALSYPYAVEHDGLLYVGYSNDGGRGHNHNSAELAVIPVAALAGN